MTRRHPPSSPIAPFVLAALLALQPAAAETAPDPPPAVSAGSLAGPWIPFVSERDGEAVLWAVSAESGRTGTVEDSEEWAWAAALLDFRRALAAGTAEGYIEFQRAHPTAPASVEAARYAALLAPSGAERRVLLEVLERLGENASARPVPLLAEYLVYPVAEVRAAAAESLVDLAAADPDAAGAALAGYRSRISRAAGDLDPRVRNLASCLSLLTEGANPPELEPEASPYATAGLAKCRERLARTSTPETESEE